MDRCDASFHPYAKGTEVQTIIKSFKRIVIAANDRRDPYDIEDHPEIAAFSGVWNVLNDLTGSYRLPIFVKENYALVFVKCGKYRNWHIFETEDVHEFVIKLQQGLPVLKKVLAFTGSNITKRIVIFDPFDSIPELKRKSDASQDELARAMRHKTLGKLVAYRDDGMASISNNSMPSECCPWYRYKPMGDKMDKANVVHYKEQIRVPIEVRAVHVGHSERNVLLLSCYFSHQACISSLFSLPPSSISRASHPG
jgi:hypothetical protein